MTDLVHGRGRGGDDGLLSKDPVSLCYVVVICLHCSESGHPLGLAEAASSCLLERAIRSFARDSVADTEALR